MAKFGHHYPALTVRPIGQYINHYAYLPGCTQLCHGFDAPNEFGLQQEKLFPVNSLINNVVASNFHHLM